VFSPLIDLHINIYQHLWNLLVITPITNDDAYLSRVYAGVDGMDLALKHHQQSLPREEIDAYRESDVVTPDPEEESFSDLEQIKEDSSFHHMEFQFPN
jgi:hypothetical protein